MAGYYSVADLCLRTAPKSLQLDLPDGEWLTVFRHRDYPPDVWLYSLRSSMPRQALSPDLEVAKQEAVEWAHGAYSEVVQFLKTVGETEP